MRDLKEFLDEFEKTLPLHVRILLPYYRWKARRMIKKARLYDRKED